MNRDCKKVDMRLFEDEGWLGKKGGGALKLCWRKDKKLEKAAAAPPTLQAV